MVKIRIISGGYGYKTNGINKLKDRNSEPFFVEEAEANRLISLGVAQIVNTDVATPKNHDYDTGAGINLSENENGENGENETDNGMDENDTDLTAHLSKEQLLEMTNKDLKKLAEDMGIDTSKMKVKKDYIDAIIEVDVYISDDGDEPPVLNTEEPVG